MMMMMMEGDLTDGRNQIESYGNKNKVGLNAHNLSQSFEVVGK
jgi:hypothetical protein